MRSTLNMKVQLSISRTINNYDKRDTIIVSSSRGPDPGIVGTSRGRPDPEKQVPGCPSRGRRDEKSRKYDQKSIISKCFGTYLFRNAILKS